MMRDEAIRQITDYLKLVRDHFDYGATTIRSLMLDHGRAFYIGERTFAGRRQTPGQCYMNAFHAATRGSGLTYVEGWCHMGLIPIEHAWCVDREGQVIDPTLPKASGYFGIPFRSEYLRRTALRTRVYGVIGIHNPELLSIPVDSFLEKAFGASRP